MTPAPLILTLGMDEQSATFFNDRRKRYFPPERNYLSAHLTLFHHLPGAREAELRALLARMAAGQPPFRLRVSEVISLGRGTAYLAETGPLPGIRRQVIDHFREEMTAQDLQPWQRPHVTVQNKVSPEQARQVQEILRAGFEPFYLEARGLRLWYYRGGPWEEAASFTFG